MAFFICMFICNMLIPLAMLIGGYCMYKHPPKKINGSVGYRSAMSRKNMDTWLFAHDYCGHLWLKIGVIMVIATVILHIPFINSDTNTIGIFTIILVTVQTAVLLLSIPPVERALMRTFDADGNRISQ